MTQGMLAWVYVGLFTVVAMVVLFLILREIYRQKLRSRRLESLAEDIHRYGRSSLRDEVQRCDFCLHTSHVHLWQYGNADTTHETLICYLCVSRIQKPLEQLTPPKTGGHPYAVQYVQHDGQSTYSSRSRRPFARR